MTAQRPPDGPPDRPYELSLDADETGTVLGALGWVLGALEIMKDRGHADGDEQYHDLLAEVRPHIERLLDRVARTRSGSPAGAPSEALEPAVEAAYARVRTAFETWIELTAVDTMEAAIGQRMAGAIERGEIEPPPAD